MKKASLQLVFHSHLPFIKHPESEWYLEQVWLFEAISESYLPLIRMLEGIKSPKVNITVSLSPTLMTMLCDEYLMEKYKIYLRKFLDLTTDEIKRVSNQDARFQQMADFYLNLAKKNLDYMLYNKNILDGFKKLDMQGKLKLITTSATYCYYPAYQPFPDMVNIQTRIGLEAFKHFAERETKTFLIPECGYYENLDKIIAKAGISYSYLAPNAILFSSNPPEYGVFNPIKTKRDVYFFVQDLKSNNLITSMNGYPSNPTYRDFFRDIGYDLPIENVRNNISPDGHRMFTGIKYHAISSGSNKQIYSLNAGINQAKQHAREYLGFQEDRALNLMNNFGVTNPVFVNYFSTELFGHRWFEGFFFLEELINLVEKSEIMELSTAESYFHSDQTIYSRIKTVKPLMSSWTGYSSMYIDDRNANVYRDLHKSIRSFVNLLKRHPDAKKISLRLLNQALRELLLSQSLDWLMIMKNGISSDYAKARIKEHLVNFFKMEESIINLDTNINLLIELETKNNIFPFLNLKDISV